MERTATRRESRLTDEWSEWDERHRRKAVRETATERGSEGVSIMKDEVKAKRVPGGRR
jgi:hypothetical protein